MVNRMQLKNMLVALAIVSFTFCGVSAQQEVEQKKSGSGFAEQIGNFTKRKVGKQKYTLAYKFKKGDVIQWKHDHRTVPRTLL